MAEGASLQWFGENVIRVINTEIARRIDTAARHVKNRSRENVSIANVAGGAGRSVTRRGSNPSKPGEFPKKVIGHLRRNIASEMDLTNIVARVGTNVMYGKWLELGTQRMEARPWLLKTANEELSAVIRIITQGAVL